MINYGRGRRRFPASGRRRKTYESTLHAFVKRVVPSRFRRASVMRFQRIRFSTRKGAKVTRHTYELTRARRLQRTIAQTVGRVSYLSPI